MLRDEREWRNVHLVEQERGDFAGDGAAALVLGVPDASCMPRCSASSDDVLAGVAAKALKEVRYHRDHATQWVLRLGDGTDESHRRMQAALEWVCRTGGAVRRRRRGSVAATESGRGGPAVGAARPASWLPCRRRPRRGDARRCPNARAGGRAAAATGSTPVHGLPAGRDAAPRPLAPGGDVVTPARSIRRPRPLPRRPVSRDPRPGDPGHHDRRPGHPADVRSTSATGASSSTITPTYSGCPAIAAIIAADRRGRAAGHRCAGSRRTCSPPRGPRTGSRGGPGAAGRFGIAPPGRCVSDGGPRPVGLTLSARSARGAARRTRGRSAGSGRRPASRSGRAGRAWSRSTRSRRSEPIRMSPMTHR